MFMALPFRYSTRPVFLHATHRLSTVMRGLDPRIHDERQQAKQYCCPGGAPSWIAGSSPAMTDERQKIQNPSHPVLVEGRRDAAAVQFQGALLADRVRALEDPVLPGGQPSEDLGLHRLGAAEPQVRLHAGERVGGEARALLEEDADLVLPVDVVEREGDEAELFRRLGIERLAALRIGAIERRLLAEKAAGEPGEAVRHRV